MAAADTSVDKRIPVLDSLRGVAALMVLATHCYAIWPEALRGDLGWLNHTPLRLLINGSVAVIFFFVLSGFVLALPFLSGKSPRYLHFVARRFCRIYLPFVAAILLALGLEHLVGGAAVPMTSAWFFDQWKNGFFFSDVLRHLAMTGTVRDMNLNSAIWTIICELRVALIFPFLIWLCRVPLRGGLCAVGLYAVCTLALWHVLSPFDPALLDTEDVGVTFLVTGRHVPFFMGGILLAYHREVLMARLVTLPRWLKLAMAGFVAAVLCAPHYMLQTALEGVSAALILIAVLASPVAQRILLVSPLKWLGRVSYSFYLVHIPVLFALFHAMDGRWSFVVTASVGTVLALIVAHIFYVVIERPSIYLGRKIGTNQARLVLTPNVPAAQ